MKTIFARKPAYAVLLLVFAAVFSYLTALMLTNRGGSPEVAPEYGLLFSLLVIALIALVVAGFFFVIVELTPKQSNGSREKLPIYKSGPFVIGAFVVIASVGAYTGFQTANSSMAAKKAAGEAEKQRAVEQKKAEETEKQKAKK